MVQVFYQILKGNIPNPNVGMADEYSSATALTFTENHCLAVAIYISPQDCLSLKQNMHIL